MQCEGRIGLDCHIMLCDELNISSVGLVDVFFFFPLAAQPH